MASSAPEGGPDVDPQSDGVERSAGAQAEVAATAPRSGTEPPRADGRPAGAVGRLAVGSRRGQWRDGLLKRMLALADASAAMVGSVSLAAAQGGNVADAFWAFCGLPLWLVLAKLHGLYDRDQRVLHHLTVDELPAIGGWAVSGTAAVAVLLTLSPAGPPQLGAVLTLLAVVAVGGAALRGAARLVWRLITPPEAAFVVGSGRLAEVTRRKIELFGQMHVRVVGGMDDDEFAAMRDTADRAAALVARQPDGCAIERLILASEAIDEPLVAELVAVCRREGIKLSVVPPVRGMFGTAVRLSHVAELPLVEYNTWDPPRSTMLLKRALDLAVSVPAVVVLAPVLLAIALAIRLESRGPSLFVQRRAGLNGEPFSMLKFRTMVVDAEARLSDVVALDELSDPMFKLRRDPRVTRLGRVLRRLSLDELPQILNVLKGDMSLVGPRPEELSVVARYAPEHRFRLSVKPGLTGPMQVYGRGELRFDERLAVEREYIENLSLGRDLRLLAMTLAVVLTGRGAF